MLRDVEIFRIEGYAKTFLDPEQTWVTDSERRLAEAVLALVQEVRERRAPRS